MTGPPPLRAQAQLRSTFDMDLSVLDFWTSALSYGCLRPGNEIEDYCSFPETCGCLTVIWGSLLRTTVILTPAREGVGPGQQSAARIWWIRWIWTDLVWCSFWLEIENRSWAFWVSFFVVLSNIWKVRCPKTLVVCKIVVTLGQTM